MNKNFDMAIVEKTTAYQLNGITYLPHYKNKSVFVGPGYPAGAGAPLQKFCLSARQLSEAGALTVELMLWPRSTLSISPTL